MGDKIPKVRLAKPAKRPYQLRYHEPASGKEVRISTGTHDEAEALKEKAKLEARLLLGQVVKPRKKKVRGPDMAWDVFREEYRTLQLSTIGSKSAECAESRLDIATRIMKPRTLGDMATSEAFHEVQSRLLAGEEGGRRKKTAENEVQIQRKRSKHTVKSYMAVLSGAINWAHLQGWVPNKPLFRKVKVSKLKHMKGRPLCTEEFERMLEVTPDVVGAEAADSWRYVLRGLWASALRIDELMHVSWDDESMIRPIWKRGANPVLRIPSEMQKNETEEEVPLLKWFEDVLKETPEHQREGWAFRPVSLRIQHGQASRHERIDSEWVGKVISKIGEKANIVVEQGDEKKGKKKKFASAHDLRRSCAERMQDAGIPAHIIQMIMRHQSWETTQKHYTSANVQKAASVLNEKIGNV